MTRNVDFGHDVDSLRLGLARQGSQLVGEVDALLQRGIGQLRTHVEENSEGVIVGEAKVNKVEVEKDEAVDEALEPWQWKVVTPCVEEDSQIVDVPMK